MHCCRANPSKLPYPYLPMYGIFPCIYHINQPNVGKYTIHGWYGINLHCLIPPIRVIQWPLLENNDRTSSFQSSRMCLSSPRPSPTVLRIVTSTTTSVSSTHTSTKNETRPKQDKPRCTIQLQQNSLNNNQIYYHIKQCQTHAKHKTQNKFWRKACVFQNILFMPSSAFMLDLPKKNSSPSHCKRLKKGPRWWISTSKVSTFAEHWNTWATKKTLIIFHYTGWFIGILIMAYYNPYMIG